MQALQHVAGVPALELKKTTTTRRPSLARSAVKPRASARPSGFPQDGVSDKVR